MQARQHRVAIRPTRGSWTIDDHATRAGPNRPMAASATRICRVRKPWESAGGMSVTGTARKRPAGVREPSGAERVVEGFAMGREVGAGCLSRAAFAEPADIRQRDQEITSLERYERPGRDRRSSPRCRKLFGPVARCPPKGAVMTRPFRPANRLGCRATALVDARYNGFLPSASGKFPASGPASSPAHAVLVTQGFGLRHAPDQTATYRTEESRDRPAESH